MSQTLALTSSIEDGVPDEEIADLDFPTVSVIVSHLNSARTIRQCLLSISRQYYPGSRFEIVVVDAGSTDGSIQIVQDLKIPNLKLLIVRGCTEPEGHNIGIRESTGEILMFTNSDVYVERDWVRRHLARLEEGYDLVGGRVFWGGDKFTFSWNMPKPNKPLHVQQVGMGLGFCNCSTRRKFIISMGGLLEISSQHDTEFAFRVTSAGKKMVLDPDIVVYHDHPLKSLKASFRRALGYSYNHAVVMRSFYGRLVCGSGSSSMITPSYVLKELLSINGISAYFELYPEAAKRNIRINLVEFIVIRILGSKLGAFAGVLSGSAIRDVSYSKIPDLHNRVEKVPRMAAMIRKNVVQ